MQVRGEDYLIRLHLFKSPWFAVMLHWFKQPDPQPDPHDHPVSFLSIVIRGWYTEWTEANPAKHVGWFNWINTKCIHRVIDAAPGTTTLCFAGPVRQRWGFYTPTGFVDWTEYTY